MRTSRHHSNRELALSRWRGELNGDPCDLAGIFQQCGSDIQVVIEEAPMTNNITFENQKGWGMSKNIY